MTGAAVTTLNRLGSYVTGDVDIIVLVLHSVVFQLGVCVLCKVMPNGQSTSTTNHCYLGEMSIW